MDVLRAVKSNNNDVGGRKFEMSDMAYIVRGLGYIKNKEEIENIIEKLDVVEMDTTNPFTVGLSYEKWLSDNDLKDEKEALDFLTSSGKYTFEQIYYLSN